MSTSLDIELASQSGVEWGDGMQVVVILGTYGIVWNPCTVLCQLSDRFTFPVLLSVVDGTSEKCRAGPCRNVNLTKACTEIETTKSLLANPGGGGVWDSVIISGSSSTGE